MSKVSPPPPPAPSSAVLAVPFIAQRAALCGPAALAMLANYYDHPVTQDEIADSIYLPDIQGTLTSDLAEYARKYGLWTRQYRGSAADLREKLAAGVPLIVLGRWGDNFHYFVVLADGDPLVVHTDARPFHELRREDFLRYWDKTDRWTLLVCPPAKARWHLSAAEENDLGLFYEQANDPCMAEAHYQRAVELAADNAWYQFNLGNACLKQAFLAEAAVAFRRALELDAQLADAHNNLAWTYHEQGERLDEAVAHCRQAIELNPAQRAWYLDTLGSVLLKQGENQAARDAFEQALAATTDRQGSLRASIRQRLAEMSPD